MAAAAFRKFWGEKAELRRFKDGSILETLVWSKDGMRPIFQQIVAHVLERHVGRDIEATAFFGAEFPQLMPTRELNGSLRLTQFLPIMTAFQKLEESVRSLEGMPLHLRQVSKADSQLRYASVRPPLGPGRGMVQPCAVVVHFEGSGRWPDEIVAGQRTKIAFLLKIGSLLEEAVQDLTARVGLENEGRDYFNNAFLDVLQPSGAAFRLRIQNEREQELLQQQLKDKNLDPRSREETVLALAAYQRDFVQAPTHTQTLCTLCTRYPLLSPTVRLVKKWFAAHLLSGHVSDEFIELLVVRSFVQPYPWPAPSSAMTGLLRTLAFLARWDWGSEPLIVDVNGDLVASDVQKMRTSFEAWRKIDPGMQRLALFVASKLDPDGVTWTQQGPSKVVAARMTALARAADGVVRERGLALDPAVLFMSSTTDYDFTLHLSTKFTALTAAGATHSAARFKNLRVAEPVVGVERVGYDPVAMFLAELKVPFPLSHSYLPATDRVSTGHLSSFDSPLLPQPDSSRQ